MFEPIYSSVRSVCAASFALAVLGMTQAHAANVTDAASCTAAVQKSEQSIVKAKVSSDVLEKLVMMAEQADSACQSEDFAKATMATNEIDRMVKEATKE